MYVSATGKFIQKNTTKIPQNIPPNRDEILPITYIVAILNYPSSTQYDYL